MRKKYQATHFSSCFLWRCFGTVVRSSLVFRYINSYTFAHVGPGLRCWLLLTCWCQCMQCFSLAGGGWRLLPDIHKWQVASFGRAMSLSPSVGTRRNFIVSSLGPLLVTRTKIVLVKQENLELLHLSSSREAALHAGCCRNERKITHTKT